MNTLTTDQLRLRMEQRPVALFDVRGDVDYEKGHIPGAKTAPLGSLTYRVASLMDRDSYVVVYSGGDGCGLATEAVERLEGLGLRNVVCYADGLAGWKGAGGEVVESVGAKKIAWGPVTECRGLVVDRETSYGGAFRDRTMAVDSAGG